MDDFSSYPDEQIVEEVLKHKDVFAVLIERYQDKLSRYLKRLGVRSGEDMQDLLQNIFIKAYTHLNDFDTSLSFSSWIYRITHNEAISSFRKKSVRPESNMGEEEEDIFLLLQDEQADAKAEAEQNLNVKEVLKALDAISQKYKDVLILRFFEERDYNEISDILQVPMGSVATLIHRAKKALKKELDHISQDYE